MRGECYTLGFDAPSPPNLMVSAGTINREEKQNRVICANDHNNVCTASRYCQMISKSSATNHVAEKERKKKNQRGRDEPTMERKKEGVG